MKILLIVIVAAFGSLASADCEVSTKTYEKVNQILPTKIGTRQKITHLAQALLEDDCARSQFVAAGYDLDDLWITTEEIYLDMHEQGSTFKEVLLETLADL